MMTPMGEQKPANAKETAKEATPDGWREERQKLLDACREYQEIIERQRKVIEGFVSAREDRPHPYNQTKFWSPIQLEKAYEFHKSNERKT